MTPVKSKKSIIVVGDRILVEPRDEDRLKSGLYLPETAIEAMQTQSGLVVKVGPGSPVGGTMSSAEDDEPWKRASSSGGVRYVPLQARVNDVAIFFRRAAVTVKYEDKEYLVVPNGAILVLLRDAEEVED